MTVLHYDESGPLSIRLYRLVWGIVGKIAGRVPKDQAFFVLSLGVPVMVLSSLLFWMIFQVLGFAAIYLAGLRMGSFSIAPELDVGVSEAIYFSAISLSGLGYGDISPITTVYQQVAGAQALLGYGVVTLAIAYVVNVYNVIREMGVLSSDLYHESERTYEARHILEVHFQDGEPRELVVRLRSFYHSMIAHHEGMRHYPLVFYFYSRRGYAALPYRFAVIGKVIAALKWGLPASYPVSREPWLLALRSAYESISNEIMEMFVSGKYSIPEERPVDRADFESDLSWGTSRDPMLRRYLELLDFMEELVERKFPRDPEELYAQYLEWLPFVLRVEMFLQASSRRLSPQAKKEAV